MSTALTTLVMENFPLFSPRTLESPCTGTKRSPDDPLGGGVLQAASGEAALGGDAPNPGDVPPPISCSFQRPFWICVGRMGA